VLKDLAGPKIRTGKVRHPADRKHLVAGDRFLLCRAGLVDGPQTPDFQAACWPTRCQPA
jgi:pyruvate kinase